MKSRSVTPLTCFQSCGNHLPKNRQVTTGTLPRKKKISMCIPATFCTLETLHSHLRTLILQLYPKPQQTFTYFIQSSLRVGILFRRYSYMQDGSKANPKCVPARFSKKKTCRSQRERLSTKAVFSS